MTTIRYTVKVWRVGFVVILRIRLYKEYSVVFGAELEALKPNWKLPKCSEPKTHRKKLRCATADT